MACPLGQSNSWLQLRDPEMIRSRLDGDGNFIIQLELEVREDYMVGVNPHGLEEFVETVAGGAVLAYVKANHKPNSPPFSLARLN